MAQANIVERMARTHPDWLAVVLAIFGMAGAWFYMSWQMSAMVEGLKGIHEEQRAEFREIVRLQDRVVLLLEKVCEDKGEGE